MSTHPDPALIDDLVLANHILVNQGVLDGFGHISVRDPANPQRFFIARSMAPALVQADDILACDLDSNVIDERGRRWVTDRDHHCVRTFDRDFNLLFSMGSEGSGPEQLSSPTGMAIDPALRRIYVSDMDNERIQVICTETDRFLFSIGANCRRLDSPSGIVVDSDGNIWVADQYKHRVLAFNSNGEYITAIKSDATGGLTYPYGMAIDRRDGRLFVVNSRSRCVNVYSRLIPVIWTRVNHARCPGAFRRVVFQLMTLHCFAERFAEEMILRGGESATVHSRSIMLFANLPRELLAVLFDLLLTLYRY